MRYGFRAYWATHPQKKLIYLAVLARTLLATQDSSSERNQPPVDLGRPRYQRWSKTKYNAIDSNSLLSKSRPREHRCGSCSPLDMTIRNKLENSMNASPALSFSSSLPALTHSCCDLYHGPDQETLSSPFTPASTRANIVFQSPAAVPYCVLSNNSTERPLDPTIKKIVTGDLAATGKILFHQTRRRRSHKPPQGLCLQEKLAMDELEQGFS